MAEIHKHILRTAKKAYATEVGVGVQKIGREDISAKHWKFPKKKTSIMPIVIG